MRLNQRPTGATRALAGIQWECVRFRTFFSILTAKQWHTAGVLAILLCLKRAEGKGEGGGYGGSARHGDLAEQDLCM